MDAKPAEVVQTSNNLFCQQLPSRMYQKCPLCNEMQPIMIRGLSHDLENAEIYITYDMGYSFCNCFNIFFTSWDNIDKRMYDELYFKKYDTPNIKKIALYEIEKFFGLFKKFNPDIKSFFEIGAISDDVLDYVKGKGLEVSGIDICRHPSKHQVTNCDFEQYYTTGEQYDVIFASHVFEHFRNPKRQLQKCFKMLNEGGLLYVAMPDTYFINFSGGNPYQWDWNVREHYILWGMDSFIEFAEPIGFKCMLAERGLDIFEKVDGSSFWKQDFKVILKKVSGE